MQAKHDFALRYKCGTNLNTNQNDNSNEIEKKVMLARSIIDIHTYIYLLSILSNFELSSMPCANQSSVFFLIARIFFSSIPATHHSFLLEQ